MAIFKLTNTIQDYAWGDRQALNQLFGIANPDQNPQAEIWMGAHPKAPSQIEQEGKLTGLDSIIAANPTAYLGEKVSQAFNGKLPYLFKVLCAGEPLSIQSHPSLAQAKEGFERENKAGIALDAFNRNYKDDNHKPELICAITPFRAMNGFCALNKVVENLKDIAFPALQQQVSTLTTYVDAEEDDRKTALKAFYTWLMSQPQNEVKALTEQAIITAKSKSDQPAFATLLELNSFYPNDIGIMCALLLNVVELAPGQAMYLDAGELHAYLKGTGMEIMANSDNVLRGGLTPKHVDVPELLSTLSFNHGEVNILTPAPTQVSSEERYSTPVSEFDFSVITLANETANFTPASMEILFCAKGEAKVLQGSTELLIKAGESVAISAADNAYQLSGNASLYKASVPA